MQSTNFSYEVITMAFPTIYPTGTTIYKPEKCFNGFTVFPANGLGIVLIDMNGAEVNVWANVHGFPVKMLKGGYIMGYRDMRPTEVARAEYTDLVQIDWDGNIVWKFDTYEKIKDGDEEERWMARVKSDFQREGNPVGYYSPSLEAKTDSGNTIMLVHSNVKKRKISRGTVLLDDTIIEVDWNGNIIWEWHFSDHFDELGFSEDAKNVLARNPNICGMAGSEPLADWLHVNNMAVVGPNKWYDAGDERFHPDNIIWDSREANIIGITSKKTGKIVWKMGPDYSTPELKKIGWIIGQHHAHIIPKGLPGEGNLLVFDNGGAAGYGAGVPGAESGHDIVKRDYSRVLEIDPTTFEIVWQYTPAEAGYINPVTAFGFYSPFISSAQRLPNGNTLICEGCGGRFIEVTAEHETVWEYIAPYYGGGLIRAGENADKPCNTVYRAYRVPYDYCPQAEKPNEIPIEPIDVTNFRVPGAAPKGTGRVVHVEGTKDFNDVIKNDNFCIATDEQQEKIKTILD